MFFSVSRYAPPGLFITLRQRNKTAAFSLRHRATLPSGLKPLCCCCITSLYSYIYCVMSRLQPQAGAPQCPWHTLRRTEVLIWRQHTPRHARAHAHAHIQRSSKLLRQTFSHVAARDWIKKKSSTFIFVPTNMQWVGAMGRRTRNLNK